MSFAIVVFEQTNETDFVPLKWIVENLSLSDIANFIKQRTRVNIYWPPLKSPEAMMKAKRCLLEPEIQWQRHNVRLLGTADNIEEARQKSKLAEDTSSIDNVDTFASGKRRIRQKRFSDSESSPDEEEIVMKKTARKKQTGVLSEISNVQGKTANKSMSKTKPAQRFSSVDLPNLIKPIFSVAATSNTAALSFINVSSARADLNLSPLCVSSAAVSASVANAMLSASSVAAMDKGLDNSALPTSSDATDETHIMTLDSEILNLMTPTTQNLPQTLDTNLSDLLASTNQIISGYDRCLEFDAAQSLSNVQPQPMTNRFISQFDQHLSSNNVTMNRFESEALLMTNMGNLVTVSTPSRSVFEQSKESPLASLATTASNQSSSAGFIRSLPNPDNTPHRQNMTGQHISNAQMNNRMLANLLTAVSDLKEAQKVQNRMLVNLLTAVGDVKETQKIHSAMLQSVLKHLTTKNAQSGEQNLPVDIEFPLKSQEEIEQLEAKLADQAIKMALVRVLVELGGVDVTDFLKRTMKYLVHSEIARKYNLTGGGVKGKKPFKNLTLCQVLYTAVKSNEMTKACNKKTFEDELKNWFGNSRDRGEGSRKNKRKPGEDHTQNEGQAADRAPEGGED